MQAGGVGFVGDSGAYNHFMSLPIPENRILAEYVWIGGSGQDLRCKTRTLSKIPKGPEDLPVWNYDGSSTGQAPGHDSEVLMVPRSIFRDPFRLGNHILVMCDTYSPDMKPIPTNTRAPAKEIFDKAGEDKRPMFAFEQEYSVFKGGRHLGFPEFGFPAPQGPYYCSVGHQNAIGRELADCHYRACLYAGIYVSGINAEVLPGQWEYQVGPVVGIEAADQLWISRYIMHRVAEKFALSVCFDPKPIPGDWNGAGCHTNFCFATFHEKDGKGWESILEKLKLLEAKHAEHIQVYGEGNERRLTGKHETANMNKFSWGVANRGASIRVPRTTEAAQRGYIEDRRPASNMDPYIVSSKIAETCWL
jgi:glutamine synthetase